MESSGNPIAAPSTRKFFLGEYKVVEATGLGITICLGRGVHITIHIGDITHHIKPGDKLPLFTEIPCDILPISK